MRSLALISLLVVVGACRPREPPRADAKPASTVTARGMFGTITPRKASALNAPPNVFRMKGWNSRSSSIKLVSLVPDGAKVDKDQEIARFEFSNEDALPWLKKRVAESRAGADQAHNQNDEEARRLRSAAAVKVLAQESAELEMERDGLVSERDLALFKLRAERAKVEANAAKKLASASVARGIAELTFFDARADDWNNGLERYAAYERRTHIFAPHAGLVRYGYLSRAHRKVQKSDEMPSGTPFAYVAEDERLSVEFLVPEHHIMGLAVGQKVNVRLPDDERRAAAVIREILPFPQEIGFLRSDDDLPDAREKVYPVIADFDPAPLFLSSGLEVRVEP